MKIAIINQWYPPHFYGGIAAYNYYIARALVARGHKVFVITKSKDGKNHYEMDCGVNIYRIKQFDFHYYFYKIPFLGKNLRFIRNIVYSFYLYKKIIQLDSIERIDIIECAEIEAEGFVFLVLRHNIPVVVRCHTPTFILKKYYTAEEMPYNTSLITSMEKYCIRHASVLTAPSHDMARTISRHCAISRKRIYVVPNALDVSPFSSHKYIAKDIAIGTSNTKHKVTVDEHRISDEVVVLHVGRLERVKGIDVLKKAIPLVIADFPRVRFVFIGKDMRDGNGCSWRDQLAQYFLEQGVKNHVEFREDIDQDTLHNCYKQADIAVVPSINYESFSYTCAQAMAAGLPVIASSIGGIPETMDHGVNGILIEPGNHNQLAQAILTLVKDKELRNKMGKAGFDKTANKFNANHIAEKTLEIYEKVVINK